MSHRLYGGKTSSYIIYLKPFEDDFRKTDLFYGKGWIAGVSDEGEGLHMFLDCPEAPHADITTEFYARHNTVEPWDYKTEQLYTEKVECDGGDQMKVLYFDFKGRLEEWRNQRDVLFYIWVRITPVIYLKTRGEYIRASKPDFIQHSDKMSKLLMTPEMITRKFWELDDEINPTGLEALSNFLSRDKNLKKEIIPKLLQCAYQLECPAVIRACEVFIVENEDEFTFEEKRKYSNRYNLESLKATMVVENDERRGLKRIRKCREMEEDRKKERQKAAQKKPKRR